MPWQDVTKTDKFRSLEQKDRALVKDEYFRYKLLPRLQEKTQDQSVLDEAYNEFMERPDDTGEGLARSMLGSAARGFLDPLAAVPEVAGAYTGIESLEELGGDIRSGIERLAPVNPAQQGLLTDIAGVGGQVAQIAATGGLGAASGISLAGKAATKAAQMQAARFGATAAQQAAMGASAVAGGLERADQLGLEGSDRLVRGLLSGGTELATEKLGGFATELGPVNKLLGDSIESGFMKPVIRGILTESGEEGAAEVAGQATDIAMAPETAPVMDLKQIGYSMLLGGAGGAMFGGVETAIAPKTAQAYKDSGAFVPVRNIADLPADIDPNDDANLVYDSRDNLIGYKPKATEVTVETELPYEAPIEINVDEQLPPELQPEVEAMVANVDETPETTATAAALAEDTQSGLYDLGESDATANLLTGVPMQQPLGGEQQFDSAQLEGQPIEAQATLEVQQPIESDVALTQAPEAAVTDQEQLEPTAAVAPVAVTEREVVTNAAALEQQWQDSPQFAAAEEAAAAGDMEQADAIEAGWRAENQQVSSAPTDAVPTESLNTELPQVSPVDAGAVPTESLPAGQPMSGDMGAAVAGANRVYINVSFQEKDSAKRNFGAKWDRNKKLWYVDNPQKIKTLPDRVLPSLDTVSRGKKTVDIALENNPEKIQAGYKVVKLESKFSDGESISYYAIADKDGTFQNKSIYSDAKRLIKNGDAITVDGRSIVDLPDTFNEGGVAPSLKEKGFAEYLDSANDSKSFDKWLADNGVSSSQIESEGFGTISIKTGKEEAGTFSWNRKKTSGGDSRIVYKLGDGRLVAWLIEDNGIYEVNPSFVQKNSLYTEDSQGFQIKPPEQMTPSEAWDDEVASLGNLASRDNVIMNHEMDINSALGKRNPVSAEAVDTYGIKLPDGYTRQGDLFVFSSPDTSGMEGVTDGTSLYIKKFGDLIDVFPFIKEDFSSLNIPRQRIVMHVVAAGLEDAKVLNSVVSSIPIDVMNMLVGGEFPPEMILNNPSVLIDALSVNRESDVSSRVFKIVTSSPAFLAAKVPVSTINSLEREGFFTEWASVNGHEANIYVNDQLVNTNATPPPPQQQQPDATPATKETQPEAAAPSSVTTSEEGLATQQPAEETGDAGVTSASARLRADIATLPAKSQAAWTPELLAIADSYYQSGDKKLLDALTAVQRKRVYANALSESEQAAYEAEQKAAFRKRNPQAADDLQKLEDELNKLRNETTRISQAESRDVQGGDTGGALDTQDVSSERAKAVQKVVAASDWANMGAEQRRKTMLEFASKIAKSLANLPVWNNGLSFDVSLGQDRAYTEFAVEGGALSLRLDLGIDTSFSETQLSAESVLSQVYRVVEEEFMHAAHVQSAFKRWQESKAGGDFANWFTLDSAKGVQDILNKRDSLRASGDNESADRIQDVLASVAVLYWPEEVAIDYLNMLDDPPTAHEFYLEAARILAQIDIDSFSSETEFARFYQMFKDMFRHVLRILRDAAGMVKSGALGEALKRDVDTLASSIRQMRQDAALIEESQKQPPAATYADAANDPNVLIDSLGDAELQQGIEMREKSPEPTGLRQSKQRPKFNEITASDAIERMLQFKRPFQMEELTKIYNKYKPKGTADALRAYQEGWRKGDEEWDLSYKYESPMDASMHDAVMYALETGAVSIGRIEDIAMFDIATSQPFRVRPSSELRFSGKDDRKSILRQNDGSVIRTGVTARAAEAARNSYDGVIPGIADTWLGTAAEFQEQHPDGIDWGDGNLTQPDVNAEAGVAADGRSYIFIDRVQLLEGDVKRAEQYGTTPQGEAVKRLLRHESFGHRGAMSLPAPLRNRFVDMIASGVIPEAELDYIVNERGYTTYAGWRNDIAKQIMLGEEWLAHKMEGIRAIPQSGPMAQMMDWLRDVWAWLTGSAASASAEKTMLPELRDMMREMHRALGALKPEQRVVDGTRASYIGESVIENMPEERKQFMRDSLDTAKAMAAAGKSSEEIRAVTGWFPGKYDGKMRWELPDDGASLRLDDFRTKRNDGDSQRDIAVSFFNEKWQSEMNEAMKAVAGMPKDELLTYSRNFQKKQAKEKEALAMFYMAGDNKDRGRVPLGYILNHDALFEAYPELRWIPVSFNAEDVQMDVAGQINPDGSIGLNPMVSFSDPSSAISTILHEIQHITQAVEGFAKGSSVDAAARRQGWNPSDIDWKQAYKDYERAAGEIEARDIQARQNFTPAQRAAIAPYSSENIAPEDAIVMFGGGSQRFQSTSNDIRYSRQQQTIGVQVDALSYPDTAETSQAHPMAFEREYGYLPAKYYKMAEKGEASNALREYAIEAVASYATSTEKLRELLSILRDDRQILDNFGIGATTGQAGLGYIYGEAALQAQKLGNQVLAEEFAFGRKAIGTSKGQGLIGEKFLVNEPRYQSLFASEASDAVTRDEQRATVEPKFGTEVPRLLDGELERSTVTAGENVADAVDSEILISEKVLELGAAVQNNPKLSDKIKAFLAKVVRLGQLKKAAADMASDTRKSIIGDASAFSKMSKEELDAAIVKLEAEVAADFAALEKAIASAEKKPKVPKEAKPIETAKAIIARVQKKASSETTKAKPKLDRVRVLYKSHLRERMDEAKFTKEAIAAGLDAKTAKELYDAAELEIAAVLLSKEVRGSSESYDKLTKERLKHLDVDSSALVEYVNRLRKEGKLGEVAWRDIMQLPPTRQQVIKDSLFDLVSQNPDLQNLSEQEKRTLADALEKMWERERDRQFKMQVKRMELPGVKKDDRDKLEEATPRLIRLINQGMTTSDAFYKAVGEQYGIKELSEADRKRVVELSEKIQDPAMGKADKAKYARELVNLLQKNYKLTRSEILSNVWVAHVLSGVRTQFDMALGVMNGLFSTVKKAGTVIYKNPNKKGFQAAGKGLQQFFVGFADGVGEAIRYVRTDEPGLIDSDIEFVSSYFDGGIAKGGISTARKLKQSENSFMRALGKWLSILERVNTGWDVINFRATLQGTMAMASQMNPTLYKESLMPTEADYAAMRERAKTMLGPTATRAQITSRAMSYITDGLHLLGKNLEQAETAMWKQMSEDFKYDARESSYMVDPTGIGGFLYRAVMGTAMKAEKAAKQRAEDAKKKLAAGDMDKSEQFSKSIFPPLMYLLATQARNILGVRFIRFTGNKINELISFIPLAGLARVYLEDGMRRDGQLTIKGMSVLTNHGLGMAVGIPALIKALGDLDDDDEERGYIVQGPWDNLTPARKSQLMSNGFKPNTIAFYDKKSGKWTSYNYINWPSAGWLATLGSVSDYRRYTPEKWNEKQAADKIMSGIYAGGSSFMDISSISQMAELFGRSNYSTDPSTKGIEKLTKTAAGYVGGFVPRLLKDVDSWMDDSGYKPEKSWEHFAKEVPVLRRSAGAPIRDIFYEKVGVSRAPWSRAMQVSPDDPVYQKLARLNSRGIWLTPPNPENRKVRRGGATRALTEDEAAAYMSETGAKYKEFIMKRGDALAKMDADRAAELIEKTTARIREIALKRAIARGGKAVTVEAE